MIKVLLLPSLLSHTTHGREKLFELNHFNIKKHIFCFCLSVFFFTLNASSMD